jgi:hypothetical protein
MMMLPGAGYGTWYGDVKVVGAKVATGVGSLHNHGLPGGWS